jgi:hypothetical protein
MTDARSERSSYKEARSAFEKLEAQDKVAFVVEATFTAVGHAIEEVGRGLADVFDGLARDAARSFGDDEPAPEQPPHEPADARGEPTAAAPGARKRGKKSGKKPAAKNPGGARQTGDEGG